MFCKALLLPLLAVLASAEDVVEEVVDKVKTYYDYTVPELLEMTRMERIILYPWTVELMSVGFILSYVGFFYLGSKYNEKLVTNVINSNIELFKEQFYQVGVTQNLLYCKDDAERFAFYCSGRLNIESFVAKFRLQARQNFFVWIFEYFLSFFMDSIPTPEDSLSLELTIDSAASKQFDDFIWGIVTKKNMNKYRNENYFLSLSKTAESTKLPAEFVFMNEVPEMNDVLYHKQFSEVLEQCKNILKYIVISDMPTEKPESVTDLTEAKKKVFIELYIPKKSADSLALHALFDFLFNTYVDYVVAKASFRPELTKKVKKIRESEVAKLQKVEDDKKKELLASKKLEEQKKLRENMSEEEQKKYEKKQLEKKQRKAMNKQKVRS